MSYEKHIDNVTTLASDEETLDCYIDDYKQEIQDSLEIAGDSMAFCQGLWDLLIHHGLVTDSTTPDLGKMEKIIDLLYAELGAATLVFSDPAFAGMPKFFETLADEWADKKDLPPELSKGARRFSARLRNTKNIEIADAKALDTAD